MRSQQYHTWHEAKCILKWYMYTMIMMIMIILYRCTWYTLVYR